uniref:Putative secreted protein n=1 Tax=Ixodes ricinus TaxID=34613 RepID=A0A6B0U464_IXORI
MTALVPFLVVKPSWCIRAASGSMWWTIASAFLCRRRGILFTVLICALVTVAYSKRCDDEDPRNVRLHSDVLQDSH